MPALNPSPVADESRGTTLLTQLAAPPGVPRASDVAAPSGAGGDPRPQAPSTPPPPGANGQPDDSLSLMAGLWPVAKPLWPHLAVALAAQLTGAVIFLLTPRAFGRVLDSVSPQAAGGLATSGMFMASIVALGALYAGQGVAAFLPTWLLFLSLRSSSMTVSIFELGLDSLNTGLFRTRVSPSGSSVESGLMDMSAN